MILRQSLHQEEIRKLQQLILSWFEENKRDFPWRSSRSPFQILISEKLLQQTAVGPRVIRAYLAIIEKYPDFQSLSNANSNDLLELIAPLGLHYRAEELIRLANSIQTKHQGNLPNDYKKLLDLPGIGEYTARAVMSFAYDFKVAIIDTNVARFLFRIFGIDFIMPANPARNRFLGNLATSILPDEKCRDFNFAILDLCYANCTPQNPNCVQCPINEICYVGQQTIKVG